MSERFTGIITPLWALSHKGDYGIGDLYSLRKFIPWAAKAGVNFLHLPPINESSHQSAYYAPISSVALDPIYLDLSQIPEISQKELIENAPLEQGDLRLARENKYTLLRTAFKKFQDRKKEDAGFLAFQAAEADWLSTYSLFRFLMTVEGENASWNDWYPDYNTADKAFSWIEKKLGRHADTIYPEILFYEWLQWHAHVQWTEIRKLADTHQIKLMSTLRYEISYNSADVFFQTENFHLETLEGAPLRARYNINFLQESKYRWWRMRLLKHTALFQISNIISTEEDTTLLEILDEYPAEFIWEPREKTSSVFSLLLNEKQQLLPFPCITKGRNLTPLNTEHYPYTSYATLFTDSHYSSEDFWQENRSVLGQPNHPDISNALRNIIFLAGVARLPLPHRIKHALDVPRFSRDMQWHIIDYFLKTNAKYTAIPLADLLYTASQLKQDSPTGRYFLVDLFTAHRGVIALQKELRLRIKMFRAAPAKVV